VVALSEECRRQALELLRVRKTAAELREGKKHAEQVKGQGKG